MKDSFVHLYPGVARLLTAQNACAYLQCTRRFLQKMVRSGRLRALKPSRKLLRFRQADLDAFLERSATMVDDEQ
jgi:excisionase family DNA binding protein